MKILEKIILPVLVLGIVALCNWGLWSIYCHFQLRFSWYVLSYWEFLLMWILITSIGSWLFKGGK